MTSLKATEWRSLPISLREISIDTTLRCGQSFRWRKTPAGEYHCSLHGRILALKQDATHLHYRAFFPSTRSRPLDKKQPLLPTPPSSSPASLADASAQEESTERLIKAYLNLNIPLGSLYKAWAAADANFAAKAPAFAGVRILRQDAWEALICFICSSNNNISRIMLMVRRLCERYGAPLGRVPASPVAKTVKKEEHNDTETSDEVKQEEDNGTLAEEEWYDFPTPAALSVPGVEAELRGLGFGYRARYIAETAQMVSDKQKEFGVDWLESLRNPDQPSLATALGSDAEVSASETDKYDIETVAREGREGYQDALAEVIQFSGVGPKVADCVALMGLGWGEAVPVDTHVWQIAVRDYKFKGKGQTMNKVLYEGVAGKFRDLWGSYAGWAHSVLFAADLKSLQRKSEENSGVKVEIEEVEEKIKTPGSSKKRVKREVETVVTEQVVDPGEDLMSRVKRRRRGR